MALDKIIVLVMALAFFGSLVLLAIKGRRGHNAVDAQSVPPPQKMPESDAPLTAKERKRRDSQN